MAAYRPWDGMVRYGQFLFAKSNNSKDYEMLIRERLVGRLSILRAYSCIIMLDCSNLNIRNNRDYGCSNAVGSSVFYWLMIQAQICRTIWYGGSYRKLIAPNECISCSHLGWQEWPLHTDIVVHNEAIANFLLLQWLFVWLAHEKYEI